MNCSDKNKNRIISVIIQKKHEEENETDIVSKKTEEQTTVKAFWQIRIHRIDDSSFGKRLVEQIVALFEVRSRLLWWPRPASLLNLSLIQSIEKLLTTIWCTYLTEFGWTRQVIMMRRDDQMRTQFSLLCIYTLMVDDDSSLDLVERYGNLMVIIQKWATTDHDGTS